MAKFRNKPVVIEATQWFKNGDHPLDYAGEKVGFENGELRTWTGAEVKANGWQGQVVRYYRHPSRNGQSICGKCQHKMHDHGWIDQPEDGLTVCPGSFVVTLPDGKFQTVQRDMFLGQYEPLGSYEPAT